MLTFSHYSVAIHGGFVCIHLFVFLSPSIQLSVFIGNQTNAKFLLPELSANLRENGYLREPFIHYLLGTRKDPFSARVLPWRPKSAARCFKSRQDRNSLLCDDFFYSKLHFKNATHSKAQPGFKDC